MTTTIPSNRLLSPTSTADFIPPEMSPGKAPKLARTVTLAHIAEQVGVSKVTVSVVLNNSRSEVRVSATTRQRILDAARELNYHPNALAQSLRLRRTNVIGFYSVNQKMFDPLYPFYGSLLKGLLRGCETHKKNFLIHGTFQDMSEDDVYLELLDGQLDGLILYAHEPTTLTERLAASHLPIVTVSNEVPGLPCVTIDAELGGKLMARYLAGQGYRNTVYWLNDDVLPSTIQLRLKGFRDEAAIQGMEVEVFHPKEPWPHDSDLKRLLDRENRPEAVAAFSDFTASHLINRFRALGLRVPEDIVVTGFDGFSSLSGTPSSFTTIRAPWIEVAQTAVSILVEQCAGTAVPMRTELPVELVLGETA